MQVQRMESGILEFLISKKSKVNANNKGKPPCIWLPEKLGAGDFLAR